MDIRIPQEVSLCDGLGGRRKRCKNAVPPLLLAHLNLVLEQSQAPHFNALCLGLNDPRIVLECFVSKRVDSRNRLLGVGNGLMLASSLKSSHSVTYKSHCEHLNRLRTVPCLLACFMRETYIGFPLASSTQIRLIFDAFHHLLSQKNLLS